MCLPCQLTLKHTFESTDSLLAYLYIHNICTYTYIYISIPTIRHTHAFSKYIVGTFLVWLFLFFYLDRCWVWHSNELFLPTIVRFLVLTAPQSPLHEENLDQLVNWQSSWQGTWQAWVRAGTGPAYRRHSWMPACPPSCLRQEMAEGKAQSSLEQVGMSVITLQFRN